MNSDRHAGPIGQAPAGLKTNKKGLRKQAFFPYASSPPPVPCRKLLKGTHYFQVGDRCLCPKVLTSRRDRSNKA